MTGTLPPVPSQSGEPIPLEEPRREAPPLGGRKRGGQRGNKNALKHGFYSHTFSRKEIHRLENNVEGEFRDEEEYLHVLIARTAESAVRTQLTLAENLAALRAVALASACIIGIHRSRKDIYDKQSTIDQIWDELKYLPVEED